MRRIIPTSTTIALFCGAVCPVYAAAEAEKFGSIVLWFFAAYCSLIVVFQVFSAARTLKRKLRDRAAKRGTVSDSG